MSRTFRRTRDKQRANLEAGGIASFWWFFYDLHEVWRAHADLKPWITPPKFIRQLYNRSHRHAQEQELRRSLREGEGDEAQLDTRQRHSAHYDYL